MQKLLTFLNALEDKKIYYALAKYRDSIMVKADVPGQRWEIEFFADGHVEVEKFFSSGEILGEQELDALLNEFI